MMTRWKRTGVGSSLRHVDDDLPKEGDCDCSIHSDCASQCGILRSDGEDDEVRKRAGARKHGWVRKCDLMSEV